MSDCNKIYAVDKNTFDEIVVGEVVTLGATSHIYIKKEYIKQDHWSKIIKYPTAIFPKGCNFSVNVERPGEFFVGYSENNIIYDSRLRRPIAEYNYNGEVILYSESGPYFIGYLLGNKIYSVKTSIEQLVGITHHLNFFDGIIEAAALLLFTNVKSKADLEEERMINLIKRKLTEN